MEKLIILDLDETLIHASDHRLPIESTYFEVGHYYVYKRPYLDQFLEFCLSEFKVAVWTSSNALYAKPVIEEIFKSEDNLQFWWSREKCTWKFDPETQSYDWLKDLKKVRRKGFNLEHVIMIDDTPEKLKRHYGNLIRVNEFFGDVHDNELKLLQRYLTELKKEENIRKIEKRGWKNDLKWNP